MTSPYEVHKVTREKSLYWNLEGPQCLKEGWRKEVTKGDLDEVEREDKSY